jgi:hypothetical protein
MGNTDYSAGDFTLTVNGREIKQFEGAEGFIPTGDTTFNIGNSGFVYGFNDQLSSNAAEGQLRIRETSRKDIAFLTQLARDHADCAIEVKATRNLDKYEADDIIGFKGGRCRLRPTEHSFGADEEAQDVVFDTLCIGFEYIKHTG